MLNEKEWRRQADHGEEYLIALIKKYLITKEQRAILIANDWEITDILNGRIPCGVLDMLDKEFFKPWNEKLGWKEFGY